ncbi:hypothetical protein, partial [[Mycobacterium] nativiensis]
PPPVESATKPLTLLESAGILSLLDKETVGAHSMSGTVTANGRTLGIQLSYLADGSVGSGTLSAGGMRGDVLINDGVVMLRGDQPFWRALGVGGPVPPPPHWVVLPADFLGGKVFMAAPAWTSALRPTPTARLEGETYFSGRDDASAKVGEKGLLSIRVGGLSADIRPLTAAEVTGPAAQLGAEHGPGVPLGRTPAGDWTLPPVPAGEASEGPSAGASGAESSEETTAASTSAAPPAPKSPGS